jgi:hypothetical protein
MGIVDAVRKIHGFKRNNEIPANEITKMDLIDDARDEAMMSAKKEYVTFRFHIPLPTPK